MSGSCCAGCSRRGVPPSLLQAREVRVGAELRPQVQRMRCSRQSSVTAGTCMRGINLPLTKWFLVVNLMIYSKRGFSAIELARSSASRSAPRATSCCACAGPWPDWSRSSRFDGEIEVELLPGREGRGDRGERYVLPAPDSCGRVLGGGCGWCSIRVVPDCSPGT